MASVLIQREITEVLLRKLLVNTAKCKPFVINRIVENNNMNEAAGEANHGTLGGENISVTHSIIIEIQR